MMELKSGSISYCLFDSVGVTRSMGCRISRSSVDAGHDVNGGGLTMMQLMLSVAASVNRRR